jgi:hypothetical protein
MGTGGQPQPQQLPLVPGAFPTMRASYIMFFHLNGQFIIFLGEDRFVRNDDGAASFEGGRFEMGPLTALWQANNVLNALRQYQTTYGQLPANALPPDTSQVGAAIDALERMLRDNRQPPPPQPPAAPG